MLIVNELDLLERLLDFGGQSFARKFDCNCFLFGEWGDGVGDKQITTIYKSLEAYNLK